MAYGLLFQAVWATVREVAARPKNLGAEVGLTAVLHTWTQKLLYHPHIHCIVPGGGLAPGRDHWIAARPDFFLAVRILSTVFRGKLLAALEAAVKKKDIGARCGSVATSRLLRQAARKKWVVYAKRPFAGPEQVVAYLGRYTHRIAIGNERILAMDAEEVTLAYKDRADGGVRKALKLPAATFLRRFLLHTLPTGFVRLRHYGLLANAVRTERLARCRELLGMHSGPATEAAPEENWEELLLRLTGRDVRRCPRCGLGRMVETQRFEAGDAVPEIVARAASP